MAPWVLAPGLQASCLMALEHMRPQSRPSWWHEERGGLERAAISSFRLELCEHGSIISHYLAGRRSSAQTTLIELKLISCGMSSGWKGVGGASWSD